MLRICCTLPFSPVLKPSTWWFNRPYRNRWKKKCICGRSSLSPLVRIIIYSLGRGSQSSPVWILNWQLAHTHTHTHTHTHSDWSFFGTSPFLPDDVTLFHRPPPHPPTQVNKLPLLLSLPISWNFPLLPYPIYSHFFLNHSVPYISVLGSLMSSTFEFISLYTRKLNFTRICYWNAFLRHLKRSNQM